ncbi:MAG: hypothetical protein WC851_02575 [Candidatus Shapirobacteria bacterium]
MKNLFFILTLAISLFYWLHLWSLRNVQAIPNPDIFQYVEDGYQYLSFRLPVSIHPPPLAPIFITSVAKIIAPYTVYPEIAAVHLINITSSTLLLVCIYIIGQFFIHPLFAFLLTCLVATNQLYILYSLGVTSEIIYAFLLGISLIYYHRSQEPLSYLLFGLLFLLRYESIVVPISVFLIEYFYNKKQFKVSNLIISFSPIVLWLLVLNYHSYGNSLIDNAYLIEIWQNYKKIPNLLSFQSLIEIVTFEPSFFTPFRNIFVYLILSLVVFGAAIRKDTSHLVKISYLIFGFHILFLYLFPNFNVRYYIPIIWIAYLILLNHKSWLVSFTILTCLLAYNFGRIGTETAYSAPHEKLEYRLVATWLNETKFDSPIKVLIYEPWILKYFVTNPQVEVVDIRETPFIICQGNLKCAASTVYNANPHVNLRYLPYKKTPTNPDTKLSNRLKPNFVPRKMLIISPSSANVSLKVDDDQFTPQIHNINAFSVQSIDADKATYKYLTTVDQLGNWANIYEYIPGK